MERLASTGVGATTKTKPGHRISGGRASSYINHSEGYAMTPTIDRRAKVLAELLAAAHTAHLPQPKAIRIDDTIRLVFCEVADLRTWASYFDVKTVTHQNAEKRDTFVESFDATASDVDVRALALGVTRHLKSVSA